MDRPYVACPAKAAPVDLKPKTPHPRSSRLVLAPGWRPNRLSLAAQWVAPREISVDLDIFLDYFDFQANYETFPDLTAN